MRLVLRIAGWELAHLLAQRGILPGAAVYAATACFICLSASFRQSYCSALESVPVLLLTFVAPYSLVPMLTGALCPVFAGDREHGRDQIPSACRAGPGGRSAAKLLAAGALSLILCALFGALTYAVCRLCGVWDGALPIAHVGLDVALTPVWPAWRHFRFALFCLSAGCLLLAVCILYISCMVRSTLAAVSLCGMGLLLEWLFHRFSFPVFLREYNLWTLLEPYSLFILESLPFPPLHSALALCAVFLPLCVAAVCRILQTGREPRRPKGRCPLESRGL